jgi:undecaprenyl-phosphate 4-deoxy-4-formamido-L-arabinose transferase
VKVSVVVPVYNGADTLEALVAELGSALTTRTDEYEVILVDDGSGDGSWPVIERLANAHSEVTGIRLAANVGEHNAVLCGLRRAQFAVTVTIDDDLQQPPREIPVLLDALGPEVDVVYGRPIRPQHGPVRGAATTLTKLGLSVVAGVPRARDVGTFRAFRTELRAGFASFDGVDARIDTLLSWSTSRFAVVPVDHQRRAAGRSNYTTRMLIDEAVSMAVNGSASAVRWALFVGLGLLAASLGLLVVLSVWSATAGGVTGSWWLATGLGGSCGLTLVAVGLVGEQVAAVHRRLLGEPAYVVAEQTTTPEPD